MFDHPVQKIKRVVGCAFFMNLEHPVARTASITVYRYKFGAILHGIRSPGIGRQGNRMEPFQLATQSGPRFYLVKFTMSSNKSSSDLFILTSFSMASLESTGLELVPSIGNNSS